MKRILLSLAAALLIYSSGEAQAPIPDGVSKFFRDRGGLSLSGNNVDVLQRIAGNKIDNVEGGGGAANWTKVDGRVFVRAAWMVEIGDIASDYDAFDLNKSLAAEMQKRLTSEGFRLTPKKFDLNYVRYQKGSTLGTIEVRSFFLSSGNLPLRYEFIFNESFRPVRKPRKSHSPRSSRH